MRSVVDRNVVMRRMTVLTNLSDRLSYSVTMTEAQILPKPCTVPAVVDSRVKLCP